MELKPYADVGKWKILFHPDFGPEFRNLPDAAKLEIGAVFDVLREFGPDVGRPHVDTLRGSAYANMKEIRASTEADWYRVAFAFDPLKRAIVPCGGGKGGISQAKFYKALIAKADARYTEHLQETGK
jgi:hypothetical protein